MAQNINKTKRRISSINSTKKITKAMELVASVKLKRFKNIMFQNECYTNEIISLVNILLSSLNEKDNEDIQKYFLPNNNGKDLIVVISSNLGLCASYNNEVFKYVLENVNEKTSIIVPIGIKGNDYFSSLGFTTIDDFVLLNEKINYSDVVKLGRYLLNEFLSGKYRSIKLIYTKYVNSIKFVPNKIDILPINKTQKTATNNGYAPIFDPNVESLISELVPLYVNSLLYQKIIEAQVSEQGSRRNAMENANDNADDLIKKLTIEYNKARQAAITQEINEVVAGQIDK